MKQRDISLRGKIIYSVYLRNHTPEGTFAALEGDLDRIKALGADIIWLLPIHPIGVLHKKGELGCPYSIRDYRGVNPEYGTLDEFRHLVDEIHARGMLCLIDVVYNHTSHDSVLREQHPEWFFRKPDGSFGNRYGDWTDVIDLDYDNPDLWRYQIDTLVQWAAIVDGFLRSRRILGAGGRGGGGDQSRRHLAGGVGLHGTCAVREGMRLSGRDGRRPLPRLRHGISL